MDLNDLIVLAALALVFAPLERLMPLRPAPAASWPRLRVDLLHVFIGGTLIRWGGAAVGLGLSLAAAQLAPAQVSGAVRALPDLAEFALLLAAADLAFYAAHRLFHAVPFLWRFHEVHHSSTHLDWIAAHRVHPVDQIVNAAIISLPILLLGFSPAVVVAWTLIYRWHAVLLHSNVALSLGPLRWIVASPQYHHWHHADEPRAWNRNFGGQLVVWDRLFGTLHLPGKALPGRYGLSAPIPETYLGQLAHPFTPERALAPAKEPA